MIKHLGFAIMSSMVVLVSPSAFAQSCAPGPATVQILGSGGPNFDPDRASTSYLLWIEGKAKMLVDMGGGARLRFAQSRAQLSDLALMTVSHLHPDHISDLPALLWLSDRIRREPLPIVGPTGNESAPDMQTFVSRMFDEKTGAFPRLSGTLGGTGSGVRLTVSVADVKKTEPVTVFEGQGLKVTALGIPHADMATLAYRVETPNGTVVFSSDQTGTDPKFTSFAANADILLMHMTIAAGTTNPLHAAPAVVGRVAQEARPKRLIVSHIGLINVDAAIAELKTTYTGELTVGADLQCTPVKG